MNWSEVTAVFGGTFDPPHLGHREAVQGLFSHPGVREVLVLPSGTPPFKPQATSAQHRLRIAELTFADIPGVRIDTRELNRAARAPSTPTYTIDTLSELKQETPRLAFVVGADQIENLHSWHRFHELLPSCHWIVLTRKPDGEAIAMKTLNRWEAGGLIRRQGSEWVTQSSTYLRVCTTEARALSSSDIRETIARETDPRTLLKALNSSLLPQVSAYLMEHRIYGMTRDLKEFYEHDR